MALSRFNQSRKYLPTLIHVPFGSAVLCASYEMPSQILQYQKKMFCCCYWQSFNKSRGLVSHSITKVALHIYFRNNQSMYRWILVERCFHSYANNFVGKIQTMLLILSTFVSVSLFHFSLSASIFLLPHSSAPIAVVLWRLLSVLSCRYEMCTRLSCYGSLDPGPRF